MAPYSHFAGMHLSLAVIAGCTLAVTLRTFGFWKWLPGALRRMRANLRRKPKAGVPFGYFHTHGPTPNTWTGTYWTTSPTAPPESDNPGTLPPRPKRKRRPKP